MEIKNIIIPILIILGVVLFYFAFQKEPVKVVTFNNLTICSWNLQTFGLTKSSNPALMNIYKDKISKCDIFLIQEIRDESGKSFNDLCNLLPNYKCYNSSRAGTTNIKEQYGLFYKKTFLPPQIIDYNNFNNTDFERPPIWISFNIKNITLNIYYLHAKPDNVKSELDSLERVIVNRGYVMVLGDFNQDCNYYNNFKYQNFKEFYSLVNEDTTVASNSCSYDKIYVNNNLYYMVNQTKIDNTITEDESDHYITSVILNI